MTKPKTIKMNLAISLERLADLRRATLIASTSASTRLASSRLPNKEVEKMVSSIFEQK